jgi:hypothetical protein
MSSAAPRRAYRTVMLALVLAVVALAVVPAMRAVGQPASCEPERWVDWHLAMRRECLTPAYVCHNMTSSKLLEDPELAAAYRDALQAGDPAPLASLDALVARMRSQYGCSDEGAAPPATRRPRLPPGHPPVDDAPDSPTFGTTRTIDI